MKILARLLILILCMTALVACEDIKAPETTAAEDVGTETELGNNDTQEPDGPEIVEFSLSSSSITQDGTTTISVTVTHPKGFAEIGGGRILDEDGTVFTTFVGSGGAFTATLSWAGIHEISNIDFAKNKILDLKIEFFDAANRRTAVPITLELRCNGAAACNGKCGFTICTADCGQAQCNPDGCILQEALNDASHCGSCDNACDDGQTCEGSQCVCPPGTELCGSDGCVDLQTNRYNCGECGNLCILENFCYAGECHIPTYTGASCITDSDCGYGTCVSFTIGLGGYCQVPCKDVEFDRCHIDLYCDSGFGNTPNIDSCYRKCTEESDCGSDETCTNLSDKNGHGRIENFCISKIAL